MTETDPFEELTESIIDDLLDVLSGPMAGAITRWEWVGPTSRWDVTVRRDWQAEERTEHSASWSQSFSWDAVRLALDGGGEWEETDSLYGCTGFGSAREAYDDALDAIIDDARQDRSSARGMTRHAFRLPPSRRPVDRQPFSHERSARCVARRPVCQPDRALPDRRTDEGDANLSGAHAMTQTAVRRGGSTA